LLNIFFVQYFVEHFSFNILLKTSSYFASTDLNVVPVVLREICAHKNYFRILFCFGFFCQHFTI